VNPVFHIPSVPSVRSRRFFFLNTYDTWAVSRTIRTRVYTNASTSGRVRFRLGGVAAWARKGRPSAAAAAAAAVKRRYNNNTVFRSRVKMRSLYTYIRVYVRVLVPRETVWNVSLASPFSYVFPSATIFALTAAVSFAQRRNDVLFIYIYI